ncbi:MAG: growth inhibitor PemK [Polynucleobacter sp. 24-46-87]|jgi:mRNA interferase MazF|uniref:type II toxin-antitoxin system PemK/MazF family toxin n=1 Tax=unclassified Polynucleobacter TaxID=2640945 RepID=UPI000BCCAD5E|nr:MULTISPECIES: type II toxin-antitoxin system PemK/MazF family toxin [unclassified Polynucleobacter]OYY08594.1 MAG: growth inhibitor PemK [Polynucleobacter sp. 35-46-11]OZA12172.1 MAG: growth inhibitor PemK [Polynucleobacter sp. 24-46-87]QWE22776.1 type II toxin-antitoxin system PemK/MazF family toxin [Polynucleobacter sp. AP-Jannik-300A-C4]
MKRGNVVTVAMQGDFGKPRPALVLQSDVFSDIHATVTVALISSEIVQAPIFRLDIEPNETNGLSRPSQVQIDKIMSIRSEKIGSVIGELNDVMMVRVNRALALWLGLA